MTAGPRSKAVPGADSDATGPAETQPSAESSTEQREGSFESSLDELEAIVDRLEAGDVPLEEALAAFEEGVSLTRHCAEQLEAAERRIDVLVKEGANWVERPFEETEDEE